MSKRVLIAGFGEIGHRLAQLLVDDGYQVAGLGRRGEAPSPVEALCADLTDPDSLACLRGRSFDIVVYTPSSGGFSEERYRAVYHDGLANVLAALETPPAQLLFVSSTSVYHQNAGQWIDECSPTEPTGFSGKVLLDAEQLALQQDGASVVRFGGIYGKARSPFIDKVRGGTLPPAEPLMYSNRIHVDDCAGVLDYLIKLAAEGEVLDSIYLAVDGQPAPLREVALWLAGQLNVDTNVLHDGKPATRGGNKRCGSDRLQKLGYRFRYPDYKAGFSAVLGVKAP